MKNKFKKSGYYLPLVLALATMVFVVTTAIITATHMNFRIVKDQAESTSALNIAEAGVNYYLWRLSKNPEDYCDGQVCSGTGPFGPFNHQYRDVSGTIVGSFSITVTPPITEGSAVEVRVIGTANSGEKRTVVASLGVPSFARFAYVSNNEAWFGSNEFTRGPVHSNRGIHFDGVADGLVTTSVASYRPTSCFGGDGQIKDGIWGDGGPRSFWQFPVPQVDFNAITSDLNSLQTQAETGGTFLPTLLNNRNQRTHDGYIVELQGTVYRLGRVTARLDNAGASGCASHGRYRSLIQSIAWEPTTRSLPGNGVLYIADNVWIRGNLDGRLTIASGRLPNNASTNTNVFLQNDITYARKDESVSLGVISQSDIVVNSDSESDLVLHGFFLSQNGRVFRPLYSNNIRDRITVYGGIASNSWWTWTWVTSGGSVTSGYRTTVQEYDANLALDPPPYFPKTGAFTILSWKEEPIL